MGCVEGFRNSRLVTVAQVVTVVLAATTVAIAAIAMVGRFQGAQQISQALGKSGKIGMLTAGSVVGAAAILTIVLRCCLKKNGGSNSYRIQGPPLGFPRNGSGPSALGGGLPPDRNHLDLAAQGPVPGEFSKKSHSDLQFSEGQQGSALDVRPLLEAINKGQVGRVEGPSPLLALYDTTLSEDRRPLLPDTNLNISRIEESLGQSAAAGPTIEELAFDEEMREKVEEYRTEQSNNCPTFDACQELANRHPIDVRLIVGPKYYVELASLHSEVTAEKMHRELEVVAMICQSFPREPDFASQVINHVRPTPMRLRKPAGRSIEVRAKMWIDAYQGSIQRQKVAERNQLEPLPGGQGGNENESGKLEKSPGAESALRPDRKDVFRGTGLVVSPVAVRPGLAPIKEEEIECSGGSPKPHSRDDWWNDIIED